MREDREAKTGAEKKCGKVEKTVQMLVSGKKKDTQKGFSNLTNVSSPSVPLPACRFNLMKKRQPT